MPVHKSFTLIRLRTGTVDNLKGLMTRLGKPSIDETISAMVRLTENHCRTLKETGWEEFQNARDYDDDSPR